ncbi:RING finger protein 207 isoform X1 [Dendroctonus ponderosae]|uniref:RING finger protein 207 n=1 Tax=Dendroctonus ponderosae TaxID=77166 RepID=A0AAR5Q8G9_DENPD|nr:RING finger protein 207 isoform X1 [Dendroctonus ponderosae]
MEPPGLEAGMEFPKNPLLCPICHDYFTEPCILSCYHTFCARCLRGREQDRKLICPFCRQPTMLKDGTFLPPPDTLMRQLIDIANSENPPCCNCDKRDRANMFYCNTCCQSLCMVCRDTTHRAKMFSSHEVVHMTKCQKEPKRCPQHGEHYIMFSPLQNLMLCVNCFRDLPNEVRTQCVDIDTAHTHASKRLERGQNAIMDLQTSVRDGIIALKGLMDELRRNMDAEKHTINTFCQGMQEAMSKTHAAMIMEVQRQYDSKERVYRSQLLLLGTVMPVLQLHLVLCTTFTAAANKYQFLELCPSLVERLAAVGNLSQPVRSLQSSQIKTNYRSEFAQCLEPWIGAAAVSQHQSELAAIYLAASRIYDTAPPATKKQQTSLKSKIMEGDSSFSAHCRSFESQIRELNQQFNKVKEKVGELHKDINAIRKAQTPPLTARYELLIRECLHLDQTLERQQQELDRMASAFDQSWEEQLWRLRVEQEVFSCQRADVNTLRNELKHLSQVATQLEPYIRTLTPVPSSGLGQSSSQAEPAQHAGGQAQQLANLLEHIGIIQQTDSAMGKIPRSRSRVLGQLLEKVRPNMQERERSKSAGHAEKPPSTPSIQKTPKKSFCNNSAQMNVESVSKFEAQIREKLHDIMCRRQSQPSSKSDTEMDKKLKQDERKFSKGDGDGIGKLSMKQRILYKKIGKSCDKINAMAEKKCRSVESEYQRISDATSQKSLHETSRSSPSSPKCKNKNKNQQGKSKKKVYPYSDGEDNIFYSLHDSADSLSTSSRRSSPDAAATGDGTGPDKTLVVVINRRQKGAPQTLAQKQRSWETFPPKHKRHHVCQAKLSAPTPGPLKKTDSFEGHEEAVRSLVAAVQETRRKPKGNN